MWGRTPHSAGRMSSATDMSRFFNTAPGGGTSASHLRPSAAGPGLRGVSVAQPDRRWLPGPLICSVTVTLRWPGGGEHHRDLLCHLDRRLLHLYAVFIFLTQPPCLARDWQRAGGARGLRALPGSGAPPPRAHAPTSAALTPREAPTRPSLPVPLLWGSPAPTWPRRRPAPQVRSRSRT